MQARGFLLQPTYRIESGKAVVHLYGRLESGASFLVRDTRQIPTFFVREADVGKARALGAAPLTPAGKLTFAGEPVVRVEVAVPSDAPLLRERLFAAGIVCFEADVRFALRPLIERGIRGSLEIRGEPRSGPAPLLVFDDPELAPADWTPSLSVLSFDIETDPTARQLLAVSLHGCGASEMLLLTPSGAACPDGAVPFARERDLLAGFCERVRALDPDVLTGWNVVDFDFSVLLRIGGRMGLDLDLGRVPGGIRVQPSQAFWGSSQASVPGRVVLDGIQLLRGAFVRMEGYSLDAVSRKVLGEGKTLAGGDRAEEILRLFREDRPRFVHYGLTDARLALEIVEKLRLIELAVERSRLTGMPPDRVAASIASFDFLYLAELSRRGIVAPTVRTPAAGGSRPVIATRSVGGRTGRGGTGTGERSAPRGASSSNGSSEGQFSRGLAATSSGTSGVDGEINSDDFENTASTGLILRGGILGGTEEESTYPAPLPGPEKVGSPDEMFEPTVGGYVLEPEPGLYTNVLVFDFKSLYPSIIRTFQIDPLGYIPERRAVSAAGRAFDRSAGSGAGSAVGSESGSDATVRGLPGDGANENADDGPIVAPNGAAFRREPGILPAMLDDLFPRREAAKKKGDSVTSNAIKILMNSFYGVLGTPACRFYNADIANAITGFGRELLLWSKTRIEGYGRRVLYGDTDSLFVLAGEDDPARARDLGHAIVRDLNRDLAEHIRREWRVESRLELEFETLYLQLLLPHVRHGTAGARKRYAGLVEEGGTTRVVFTGMEVVRRDWTDLAKQVQREMYERLFAGQAVGEYLRAIVADLRAGRLDKLLVYRKALRKKLADYTASTPPHVAAARKMTGRPGRLIAYVMTGAGPEPAGETTSPLDREHYVQKQVRPVAEPVLDILGLDFDRITGDDRQPGLF